MPKTLSKSPKSKVGVFALQGDFERHAVRLAELGAETIPVATSKALAEVDRLVIPGGESSVLLKLCDEKLKSDLIARMKGGMPVLATCAGLILLAERVTGPEQYSLGCLNVTVERNAYGRQVDSFVCPALHWTPEGREYLQKSALLTLGETSTDQADILGHDCLSIHPNIEGVFIRAPRIKAVGTEVTVLITHNGEPVLVSQGNILGATFHPEVTPGLKTVHEMLCSRIRS